MLAGLTAGAIAAIIAALVSLPLHSPVDSLFNSATVAVVAIVVGGISGLLWTWLSTRLVLFLAALAGLFVIALVIAFVGNTQLDRMVSYMVPLAAIVVIVCAVLTPLLASFFLKPALGLLKWSPVVAVIVALVVGFALITQGDAESGELALPPPPTAGPTAPVPTATAAAQPSSASAAATPEPEGTDSTAQAPQTQAPVATSAPTAETTAPVAAEATSEPTQPDATAKQAVEAQQFIIGEGSKVTFTVEEELGRAPVRFDAVISSTGLSGTANLDGQPSVVTLDLHSLQSDQQYRDRYIQGQLFPDTLEAIVTVDELPDLTQSFLDGEEATGLLNGSLQIGEAVTPLEFDVTARKDSNVINVLGVTTFTWEQLGLTKPTARSVVYLADEVSVQVLLVATAP
jgi:hypothetical protein